MKTTLTIYMLLILLGCAQSDEVIGHWHIKGENSNPKNYIVMDVTEDTVAYLGKNSIHGQVEGIHNRKENILFFPGDCGVFKFEYELKDDKIYLGNYLENYIGEKCGRDCCDKLTDFKKDIKLAIDFPKIVLNRELLKPIELVDEERLEEIVIGKPKSRFDHFYEDKIRLELAGKFASIDDISIWTEYVKTRYAEQVVNRIIFRILADKSILLSELNPIIIELRKNGIDRILLTCLKENFEVEERMFEYVRIEKINFEEKIKLSEILK